MNLSELRRLAEMGSRDGWVAVAVSIKDLDALLACAEALKRAAYVAEHLMQMIPQEDWRDTGGDDGQGHYEGDYRAARLMEEIKEWAALAALDGEQT